MTILASLIAAGLALWGLWAWANQRKRQTLLHSKLTDRQVEIMVGQVPLLKRMPAALRAQLEGKISLFLDQVEFIGCNDFEVTEEVELSIAAQACLLVVNTDTWYETLRTILIYPGAFKSTRVEFDGFVAHERETVRTGESWARGPVILSWQHSEHGAANDSDGTNVVFHEFAHQLDNLSGHTDGAPVLNPDQSFADWAQVFTDAFDRLVVRVERGKSTEIDPYGATGPEEFFAVSVELFFEDPARLNDAEPDVYRHLSDLLRLDPMSWI